MLDLTRKRLKGISKFYERTKNWEKYADTLVHLMGHFSRK